TSNDIVCPSLTVGKALTSTVIGIGSARCCRVASSLRVGPDGRLLKIGGAGNVALGRRAGALSVLGALDDGGGVLIEVGAFVFPNWICSRISSLKIGWPLTQATTFVLLARSTTSSPLGVR